MRQGVAVLFRKNWGLEIRVIFFDPEDRPVVFDVMHSSAKSFRLR